jgi:hypothetical protein
MKHKTRGVVLVVVLILATLPPAHAFLGIGDVVFDPSNYAQAIQQLLRLEQQYRQLVETYQVVRSQYNHALRMARRVPVDMTARYKRLATPWEPLVAANTYGTTSAWVTSVNSGVAVAENYLRSVEALATYGAGLKSLPADQQGRVQAAYGAIELADGAGVSALATIGALRGGSEAVESAIARLEADSLSSAPEMNTEIAVLNKLNAASLVAVHAAQDTNKLLVALAEQEVLVRKRERDAQARAINQHIRFTERGKAALAAQARGASDAMRAWRMP